MLRGAITMPKLASVGGRARALKITGERPRVAINNDDVVKANNGIRSRQKRKQEKETAVENLP